MHTNLEQSPAGKGFSVRILILVGLIIAFLAASVAVGFLTVWLELPPLWAATAGQVGILLVGVGFALADGDGFRSLGLTGSWKGYDAGVIPAIILVQMVGSGVTAVILEQFGLMEMEGKSITTLFNAFAAYSPGSFMGIALLLAFMAGLSEEILFRGYIMTRLERLGLGAWSTILLSALIFGLVHWPGYGLLPSLSKAVWFGIPTGAYFWYRRSLGPLVVAHALLDYIGFVLAYIIVKFFPGLSGF